MLRSINLDLSNENIWFDLNSSYRSYELTINNADGSNVTLKLDKRQLEDILKELLGNDFFEVDEDGEVCIADF